MTTAHSPLSAPATAPLDAATLWQQDKDHFIHPFTDFSVFHEKGCELITDAEGIYVQDVHGNRFIDGIAGLWCVNVGHGRAEIGQAMADQATRMAYFSTFNNLSNAPAAQLAAKLADLPPTISTMCSIPAVGLPPMTRPFAWFTTISTVWANPPRSAFFRGAMPTMAPPTWPQA